MNATSQSNGFVASTAPRRSTEWRFVRSERVRVRGRAAWRHGLDCEHGALPEHMAWPAHWERRS